MSEKDRKPGYRKDGKNKFGKEERPRRKFSKDDGEEKPRRKFTKNEGEERPRKRYVKDDGEERPRRRYVKDDGEEKPRRRYVKDDGERPEKGTKRPYKEKSMGKPGFRKKDDKRPVAKRGKVSDPDGLIRLNKFVANSGVCSRREADKLIEAGAIKVNGKVVTELGTKIKSSDKVLYGDQALSFEKHVYLLLNKPKDYITTTDDPQERRTVMHLVGKACKERIYPVGRLDKNTTGLLLFTNDGELAKKLIHPKHQIKKVYHVTLDKSLTKSDMLKIIDGIDLEDGKAEVDKIAYVESEHDKRQIGIELHSGKNRIIRRIFESLEYRVHKLDRVMFAGLTKKDLPRGKWRFLKPKEVNLLMRMS